MVRGAHRADARRGAAATELLENVPDPVVEAGLDVEPPTPGSLSSSVRRGVGWTSGSRLLAQVAQFASTIVLARLLVPADFGLASLVIVITGFANVFVDLGLGAAVIQSRTASQSLLSTAFWLNFGLGWVLFLATSAAAIPLAEIFGHRQLLYLTPIAALSFALSLSIIPRAILQRRMQFMWVGVIDGVPVITTIIVSIIGAYLGYGALALVLGTVSGMVAGTVVAACVVRWRPSRVFSRGDARSLWAYSRGMLGFGVINYWSRNLDNLLVGRYLGTVQLGFYARAYNVAVQPVSQMSAVLTSVLFPALSTVQDDLKRFRHGWYQSCKVAFAVATPVAIGIVTAAPAFVQTLYGHQWLPMVGALSYLCAAVPFSILGSNTGPVFQALGRTGLQFRLGLVQTAMTVVAIVVGLRFGITAVAFGLLIRSGLNVGICLGAALRLIGGSGRYFTANVSRPALATAIMAAASLLVRYGMQGAAPSLVLVAQAAACLVAFIASLLVLDKGFVQSVVRRRTTSAAS